MEKVKFILFCIFILSVCNKIFAGNYEGYKVFKVYPEKVTHQKVLELLHSTSAFDFWTSHKHLQHPVIIMVNPNMMEKFHSLMKKDNINYQEIINNVGSFLEREHARRISKDCSTFKDGSISFCRYHSYKTIKQYLENLHERFPRKIGVFSIGRTIEGRDILGVRIPNERGDESDKPTILIDAGIHAREWISPAAALYLISQLVERCYNEPMFKSVNWFILPLLNPDGYEYSQKWDRLWRKSRAIGKVCYGVDINRNFGFHWMEGGSSADECSETYAGKAPFSEPETCGFRDFVLANQENIKIYITLHSYGNYILYPWNYTPLPPNNEEELTNLAEQVGVVMEKVNGNKYSIGSSGVLLYKASGNSEDWMKGIAGVELSFAIELPGGGETGFDVPEGLIEKIGREAFQGFKVFENYAKEKWNPK